ncbi:hypothetical protein D915_003493 [Fasciola hepatica]|uniref:Uncharacterized protein n=1 Tax=Fasciola hepatica TaxID=6192 RepID=A0A4E0RUK3_FASHE|nr:hypothetical protein D915_003493 [Fasciola hepatica]
MVKLVFLLALLFTSSAHGVILPASCNPFCDRNYVECILACDYQIDTYPWECRAICALGRQQCVVENCPIATHSLRPKVFHLD